MNRRDADHYFVWRFVIFSLCIALCVAYTGIIAPDPENPGKCFYRGDALKVGVTNVSAPCQRLTCNDDGTILIEGCGKLRLENCNRGERINVNKPYPECCYLKYKCEKSNGETYYIDIDVSEIGAKSKSENST